MDRNYSIWLPVLLYRQSASHSQAADHQISDHTLPSLQSADKNNKLQTINYILVQ